MYKSTVSVTQVHSEKMLDPQQTQKVAKKTMNLVLYIRYQHVS
jgi:hypothetical protein